MLASALYSIILLIRIAFPLRTSVNFFSQLFPHIEPFIWTDSNTIFQGLDNLLAGNSYYGEWTVPEGLSLFDFSHQKGYTRLSFTTDHWDGLNTTIHEQLFLYFYDGVYIDDNSVRFALPKDKIVPIINITNMTLTYSNFSVNIFPKYSNSKKCIADMNIYFLDVRNGLPLNLASLPDSDHVGLQIFFNSSSCGLSLSTSVANPKDPVFMAQLTPYAIIMYLTAVASALAYFSLYTKSKTKPLFVLDVSLGTLNCLATFDIFLFFDHVYTSTVLGTSTTRPVLQGIGIVYASIFAFFNLPLVMEIKYQTTKLPWKDVIKKLNLIANISLVFNILTFIFAFETIVLQQRLLFYAMFSLFLLPQIIQNFVINKRQRWNCWYLGVLFIPKIGYFVYTEGHSHNIFRIAPNMTFCIIILTLIAIQFILLLIQSRWPRFWFKKQHAYTITKSSTAPNCPICLQDFDASDNEAKSSIQTPLMKSNKVTESVVNTPCHHEFHLTCLKSWLSQKFECPYCRQALPFTHQLDDYSVNSLDTLDNTF